MLGILALHNNAVTNGTPQPSASTDDTKTTILDQVIHTHMNVSLPLAPEKSICLTIPPIPCLYIFIVSKGENNAGYNSNSNAGPSFKQVEDEPNIDNYHEDKVVPTVPVKDTVAQE